MLRTYLIIMTKNLDEDLKMRKALFLKIYKAAKRKYENNTKRLAGEGWSKDWNLLFATMMSAQTRDETTIPVAEAFFQKYKTLEKISKTPIEEISNTIRKVNYNRTKAKNIKAAASILIANHNGKVPRVQDELIKLPGVGRKTANLVLGELEDSPLICVDTHVHRISNALDLVKTKTTKQTEIELMKIAPKKYWNKINRYFVLWGKEVPGKNKDTLLEKINIKKN
jgi:endonuclease III